MIIGLGIDTVEIARFSFWHCKSMHQLQRLLSEPEIAYCLQDSTKSAQRFAVRFAAREALYKAITQAAPLHTVPLLTLCRAVTLIRQESAPTLTIDWNLMISYIPDEHLQALAQTKIHCSLSHNKTEAIAVIILEK